MEKLTGPQLFLRYAFPCAEGKLHANQINQAEFESLESFIKNGGEPEIFLLQKCFPNAAKDLKTFSEARDREMWATRTVAKLWRYHHGHNGDCAVKIATVCSFVGDSAIQVISGSKVFTAFDTYGLGLDIGDDVYIHHRVIVEKAS